MSSVLARLRGVQTSNTYSELMHDSARMYGKPERQRLIASLVTRRRVGTKFELLAALEAAGCRVTQATVSRDIRALGLEKTHDALGRSRYSLPDGGRRTDPGEALTTILGQFGRRATAAENIVVLHSEVGAAPAIARALDRVEHPNVVGTLAGDDTCLVIARDAADAKRLAAELSDAMS